LFTKATEVVADNWDKSWESVGRSW